jgi:cyclohexyl-isocyanide hydratase
VKTIGIYLWPNMTSLDVLGPHQFFGYVPEFNVVTVAKSKEPVVTDTKLRLLPDHDFSTCPPVDVLLVGGGIDPSEQLRDEAVLSWVRATGEAAEYVTSTSPRPGCSTVTGPRPTGPSPASLRAIPVSSRPRAAS